MYNDTRNIAPQDIQRITKAVNQTAPGNAHPLSQRHCSDTSLQALHTVLQACSLPTSQRRQAQPCRTNPHYGMNLAYPREFVPFRLKSTQSGARVDEVVDVKIARWLGGEFSAPRAYRRAGASSQPRLGRLGLSDGAAASTRMPPASSPSPWPPSNAPHLLRLLHEAAFPKKSGVSPDPLWLLETLTPQRVRRRTEQGTPAGRGGLRRDVPRCALAHTIRRR